MPRKGLTVVKQRQDYDCGLAALSTLLDIPYADVSAKARQLFDVKGGLWLWQIQEIAEELGGTLKLVFKSKHYLEGRTGILSVVGNEPHVVVLKDGSTVIDPEDGTVWKLDEYLKSKKCRTGCLLVEWREP